MRYINEGYTIGVGHRDKSKVYKRAYLKTRDQNQDLPQDQHRPRIETNLRGQVLADLGNDADNLKHLVNEGFRHLRFTKLNDNATAKEVADYHNSAELFGRESCVISKSRHKRKLHNFIKPHSDLNRVIDKAVWNFSRNF